MSAHDQLQFYQEFFEKRCFNGFLFHSTKVGRYFHLSPEARLIVGRNEEENKKIMSLSQDVDIIFGGEDFPGPAAPAQGENNPEEVRMSAVIYCEV